MKKIDLQRLLLIFIVLLPILDIVSYGFRKVFATNWSPSTFIRPIIPMAIFIIIFFKNKLKLKTFIVACVYLTYSIIHLALFHEFLTGISFGSITHELQYMVNYTFNILTLFIFLFVFYNKDLTRLKKYIIITFSIYMFSIYLSIITNTYTSTYVEGTGIKGWFESGNSLSASLIIGLFIIFSLFNTSDYKKYLIFLICLAELFLLVLIGTRTALFGGLIVALLYIIFTLFYRLKSKIKITKKIILFSSLSVIFILIAIFFLGSKTIERRKYLASLNSIIDEHTGETLHVTSDISDIYYNSNNDLLPGGYMSLAEKQALNDLYAFANKYKISCTNRRVQEFIYNVYLVKNQKSILGILFGNGLLNNYAELVLEIEIPAFILNFGIAGFILYFIPFVTAFIYSIYNGFKYRKKVDAEFLMLISGLMFSLVSACFTGVTFFNTSSATLVTIIIVMLINRISTYKLSNSNNI